MHAGTSHLIVIFVLQILFNIQSLRKNYLHILQRVNFTHINIDYISQHIHTEKF